MPANIMALIRSFFACVIRSSVAYSEVLRYNSLFAAPKAVFSLSVLLTGVDKNSGGIDGNQ